MNDIFLLHTKNGNKIYKKSDLIDNAKKQEKAGIKPCYKYFDGKTPAGWLVFSTWEDGAGIVYKNTAGRYCLISGTQGDFCFI